MSLVQLPYPIRTQNISLFYSNVCKQSKRNKHYIASKHAWNDNVDIMDGQSLRP
jgi:glutaredoxin-related protein